MSGESHLRQDWNTIEFGEGFFAYSRFNNPDDAERICIIDVGSNSAKMVTFATDESSAHSLPKLNFDLICGLGEGMQPDDENPVLNETGLMKYVDEFLPGCRRTLDEAKPDIILVLCTEAVRAAKRNPEENAHTKIFLERTASVLGIDETAINILSEDQEADLAQQGVLCGDPTIDGYTMTVGGGSTEISKLHCGRIHTDHRATLRFGVRSLVQKRNPRSYVTKQLEAISWYKAAKDGTRADKTLALQGGTFRVVGRLLAQRINNTPISASIPSNGMGFLYGEQLRQHLEDLKTKSPEQIKEECLVFFYRSVHSLGKHEDIDMDDFRKWKAEWEKPKEGKKSKGKSKSGKKPELSDEAENWYRKFENRIGKRAEFLHAAVEVVLASVDHLKPHTVTFGKYSIREGVLRQAGLHP